MIVLVSYATPEFYESQRRLNKSAERYVDKIFSYNTDYLKKTGFYQKNQKLLEIKIGGGCCLWKPYLILEAMKELKEGDIVIYCDSGIELLDDPKKTLKLMTKDGFLFLRNPTKARNYTKRDCFILMNCDSEKYWNSNHMVGGFNAFKKNKKTLGFLKEWLKFCEKEDVISPVKKSVHGEEFPEFIQHTYDQSVLSLLVKKHGIESHEIYKEDNTSRVGIKKLNKYIIDVHRSRKRTFTENLIFRIKLIIPARLKNRIKQVRNRLK